MKSTEEQLAELEKLTAEELIARGRRLIGLGNALLGQVAQLTGEKPGERLEQVQSEIEVVTKAAEPEPEPVQSKPRRPEEEHSVGRFGVVTYLEARKAAEVLGDFNRKEYAQKTGLKLSETQRWLSRLLDEEVIEYEGSRYYCLVRPSIRDWIVGQQDREFSIEDVAEACGLQLDQAAEEMNTWQQRRVVEQVNGNGTYRYIPPDPRLNPKEHETKTPPEKLPPCGLDSLATGMPVRVKATQKATRRQRSVSGAGGIKGAKARDRRYEEAQAKRLERAEAKKAKAQKQPDWQNRSGRRSKAA